MKTLKLAAWTPRLICALVIIAFSVPVFSQVTTLYAPELKVDEANRYHTVNIGVKNFTQIVGLQFTLKWDETVLSYYDIESVGLDGLSADDHFGKMEVEDGTLSFAYVNMDLKGVSLQDSASLFAVTFELLGEAGDVSPLAFTSSPTAQEATDTTFNVIPFELINGKVTVESSTITSTFTSSPDVLTIKDCFPNPFQKSTAVDFNLKKSDKLTFSILSMDGKLVKEEQLNLPAGTHRYEIDAQDLSNAGTYYLQIKGNGFNASQRLVYQK